MTKIDLRHSTKGRFINFNGIHELTVFDGFQSSRLPTATFEHATGGRVRITVALASAVILYTYNILLIKIG